MADIDFKNGVNVDTAYVDGHKVKLIAVPDGTLELPISANDEYGYVVDANGKKHRVLLTTFLSGDPDYKPAPNADTAYMTVNSQKVKVRLGAKLNGTQYLSDSANVNDCYTEDDDGNKHKTILVAEPTGTLELPTSETSDSAYVIDNDGNKHKVRLFAVLAGGTTIVEVTVSGVPPLNLLGAVEDSLSELKAYGGLLQSGVPTGYTAVEYVENAADTMVKSAIHIGNEDNFKMDITATVVTGSFYLFQARDAVSTNHGNATICGISGSQNGGTIIGGSGGSTSLTSGITRPNRDGHKLNIVFECADGDMSLYVKDIDGNVSDTKTGTYDPTELTRPTTNMCIYGNEAPTISTALPKNRLAVGCKVYGAKLWKNGVLVMDYVPATRDSDSAVGFYDRITKTFITAADGSLTAGNSLAPTPSDPVDLVCNNGALKILDKSQWTIITNPSSIAGQGAYINTSGKWQVVGDRSEGCVIPLTVGKQYTMVIHKKTIALGTMLRYGQSPRATPTNDGVQLTDWYRGTIADGMMISFVAKQPYFVTQFNADPTEAGMVQEAIEVLEAQGDNEILAITTKNLCNVATDIDGYYIGADGTITASANSCYSALIPVEAGQTYTWSGICGGSSYNNKRVHAYVDGVWNQQLGYEQVTAQTPFAITFTVPAGVNAIRISHFNDDTQTQVEVGSTKTSYIEYNGSTAGVANLLKMSNYVDTQEILTGLINHQLGIYVFDGTEDWTEGSTTSLSISKTSLGTSTTVLPSTSTDIVCTHYQALGTSAVEDAIWVGASNVNFRVRATYATISDWKTFLAGQHAAGTPVIIVYPLATAQDAVAPVAQTMQTVAGDNTLEIVQAGMSGLEVSATYMKGVSVTITEIENANIGNNVEVIIA